MLALSLLCLGLASFSFAFPVTENAVDNTFRVFVTDTETDSNGIERRTTAAVDKAVHDRLVYYSEYAAAAYCPPQQAKEGGGKVACSPAKTCGRVEQSDTKIYTTWLK